MQFQSKVLTLRSAVLSTALLSIPFSVPVLAGEEFTKRDYENAKMIKQNFKDNRALCARLSGRNDPHAKQECYRILNSKVEGYRAAKTVLAKKK